MASGDHGHTVNPKFLDTWNTYGAVERREQRDQLGRRRRGHAVRPPPRGLGRPHVLTVAVDPRDEIAERDERDCCRFG